MIQVKVLGPLQYTYDTFEIVRRTYHHYDTLGDIKVTPVAFVSDSFVRQRDKFHVIVLGISMIIFKR